MMGVIQPRVFSNTMTAFIVVLTTSKVSWITILFNPEPLVLARQANRLAMVFFFPGNM